MAGSQRLDADGLTPYDVVAHGLWDTDGGLLYTLVLYGSVAALGFYGIGVTRLRGRPPGRRTIPPWRIAAFAGGVAVGLLMVSPPVDEWAEELFSAHMVQHLVLAFVVAPLLVLGRPLLVTRVAVGSRLRIPPRWHRWFVARRASVTCGLTLAAAHVFIWYLWHLPGVYEVALQNPAVHGLEHAMFVISGMTLTWHAAALEPGLAALLGTVVSMIGVMPLAALLVFTDRYWYGGHAAQSHGLTALEDQQLGGALMWFPGALAYLVAVAVIVLRRLATTAPRVHGGDRADQAEATSTA